MYPVIIYGDTLFYGGHCAHNGMVILISDACNTFRGQIKGKTDIQLVVSGTELKQNAARVA